MPHGTLTLLGRQLRSVLASLGPRPPRKYLIHGTRASFSTTRSSGIQHARVILHASTAAAPAAAADEHEQDQEDEVEAYLPFELEPGEEESVLPLEADQSEVQWSPQYSGWQRVHRDPENEEESLKRGIGSTLTRGRLRRQRDDTNNHWSRHDYSSTSRRLQRAHPTPVPAANELTFEKILESYVQHQSSAEGIAETEQIVTPFGLCPSEQELLDSRGYVLDNIKGWAHIVTMPDSVEAATKLEELRAKFGVKSVPLFVVSHLLRRQYISARALRILLRLAWSAVDYHATAEQVLRPADDDLFALFIRLLRHARAVWPSAMTTLPELLLHYLPHNASEEGSSMNYTPITSVLKDEQLESLTHKLNRAMRLIAYPTSVEPFKSNTYQETAIVSILRFMAEHNPPLGINREGYRAVIMLQLAQKKSPSDQQWAELKALSWPPWKEERTAMDADITVEQHGMTKAAETLERMREAGYGQRDWEKVAAIYTGWDTDRTPTIQTRVSFGFSKERFDSGAAVWTARIETTRTVQEAWACYLAYEDEGLPPNQDVYLVIFRKLHENDLRLKGAKKYAAAKKNDAEERTWPGDTREVEPLPPSTHLYTYTRTSPPTLNEFYEKLRERRVVFEDRCIAFLIANAGSLQQGLKYVRESESKYPAIRGLVPSAFGYDLSELPNPVFTAFLVLLGRFSKVPLSKALPSGLRHRLSSAVSTPPRGERQYKELNFDPDHALTHAIELLQQRKPLLRPAWNAIFRSLGNESSFPNVTSTTLRNPTQEAAPLSAKQNMWRGAITAYRLARRVWASMREIHLDPDIVAFLALCQAAENLMRGCWMLMLDQARRAEPATGDNKVYQSFSTMKPNLHLKAAVDVGNWKGHITQLKDEFKVLVGEEEADEDSIALNGKKGPQLPRLIEVPGPALLHAYVRALGWMADYEGLVQTVHFMVKYQAELAERRARDKSGESMMRRVMIALRVFLERSWIPTPDGREISDADLKRRNVRARLAKHLHKLESPAEEGVVNEVRELVDSVDDWGGWATDQEVESYCGHSRFQQFL